MRCQQRRVPSALVVGIGGLTVDHVELGWAQRVDDALAHVPAEAGGVVSGKSDVLVHVETGHERPVHTICRRESVEKRELRVPRGEHDVGLTAFAHRAADDLRRVACRRGSQSVGVVEDPDVGCTGPERFDHAAALTRTAAARGGSPRGARRSSPPAGRSRPDRRTDRRAWPRGHPLGRRRSRPPR